MTELYYIGKVNLPCIHKPSGCSQVYRCHSIKQQELKGEKIHGLTVTPIAQSLTDGASPLSGGGWKEPPKRFDRNVSQLIHEVTIIRCTIRILSYISRLVVDNRFHKRC